MLACGMPISRFPEVRDGVVRHVEVERSALYLGEARYRQARITETSVDGARSAGLAPYVGEPVTLWIVTVEEHSVGSRSGGMHCLAPNSPGSGRCLGVHASPKDGDRLLQIVESRASTRCRTNTWDRTFPKGNSERSGAIKIQLVAKEYLVLETGA